MGSQPPPTQRLYFLDTDLSHPHPRQGRILSCHPDGTNLQTIIDNLPGLPDSITLDRDAGHMYWTNMGGGHTPRLPTGSIERANLDGSGRKVVVPPGTRGVFTPQQITARGGTLYWCDREGMKVMRCSKPDGADLETLVSTGDTDEERGDPRRWCVGVAVDEPRGVFYWTQKGGSAAAAAAADGSTSNGKICRARIQGPQGAYPEKRWDVEVVFDGLPEPLHLDMDEESQSLYWTDRGGPKGESRLNRAAVGMGGVPQVLATGLRKIIGLAVDREADMAYVTDLAGGVYAIDIKTRRKTALFNRVGDITGIALG
ncbi:YWTD domain-containing protein [Cryphonectria parasitica EP155]|uniref:YWTD domain-containing protein n=1 Tax=Cryphonectria parasitica (strain ATCC 38755 / EP155) TaxID=660469 RepID=A0A9P4Y9L4_CRYP1|nr:YWTD domain-containing protein [Cryphonectria parasitica EP155]KAF3769494.1 YWTD domain-containing protein [Cryphonectria parasitica EP155]